MMNQQLNMILWLLTRQHLISLFTFNSARKLLYQNKIVSTSVSSIMCDIRQIGSLILLLAVFLVQSSVAARTNNTFKTDTAMLQVGKKYVWIISWSFIYVTILFTYFIYWQTITSFSLSRISGVFSSRYIRLQMVIKSLKRYQRTQLYSKQRAHAYQEVLLVNMDRIVSLLLPSISHRLH